MRNKFMKIDLQEARPVVLVLHEIQHGINEIQHGINFQISKLFLLLN